MKVNPVYTSAPYQLDFITHDKKPLPGDSTPHRFATPPPEDLQGYDALVDWVMKNSIPPYIED